MHHAPWHDTIPFAPTNAFIPHHLPRPHHWGHSRLLPSYINYHRWQLAPHLLRSSHGFHRRRCRGPPTIISFCLPTSRCHQRRPCRIRQRRRHTVNAESANAIAIATPQLYGVKRGSIAGGKVIFIKSSNQSSHILVLTFLSYSAFGARSS